MSYRIKILRIFVPLFLINALTSIYSCKDSGNDPEPTSKFSLYQSDNEYLYWSIFQNIENRDTIKLKEWLTSDMIKSYDFSSHIIELNSSGVAKIGSNLHNTVIVPMVDGKRCYYGCMIGGYLSPSIPVYCMSFDYNNNLLWLFTEMNYFHKDVRNDERIKQALISDGKYHAGIKLTINNLNVVKENDTTKFVFSITIKNEDKDNVYLIDPNDINLQSFLHWYNYGVSSLVIYKKEDSYAGLNNHLIIPSELKGIQHKLINDDSTHTKDLLYLKSGESLNREYKAPLWQNLKTLPYGDYLVIYRHVNSRNLPETKRNLSSGRILLGSTFSNILDITYSKEKGIVINNSNVVLE